jgi:2-hydroxy-3-keto-5-methylthiopentenyl-1-phosphate phosphatase
MTNLAVLCDFDGTITIIDTAEFILAKFARGDWKAIEEQFERGKITLEECVKKQFLLVKASRKQILNELEKVVTFRPSFEELAKFCKNHAIPIIIVSAGLDFVIDHFLELKGWKDLVTTYTAKTRHSANGIEFTFPSLFDKTSVNFKHDLVRHRKSQGNKVIFIGDGSGDYSAAMEADFSFAIGGSRLAKLCESRGANCSNIDNFREVVEAIRRLTLAK